MSNVQDHEALARTIWDASGRFYNPNRVLVPAWEDQRLSASRQHARYVAEAIVQAGFRRTPALAPDLRALIDEAREVDGYESSIVLNGLVDKLADALEAAIPRTLSEAQAVMTAYHLAQSTGMSVEQVVTTLREIGTPAPAPDVQALIAQLTTDLDARFEHSDHTAAKYYQRMRAAEKESVMRRSESADLEKERDEAVERLDRVHAMSQPWADRIDLEQVGTHSPDCHTRHVDCLILSIRHAITNGDTQ